MATMIPQSLRETCRAVRTDIALGLPACVPLWPLHAERLAEGGCSPALLAAAEDAVLAALASCAAPAAPAGRLRVSLLVPASGEPSAAVAPGLSSLDVPGGPRIALVRVDAPPELPAGAAKPADRAYWDAAMRRARPAQQAVLVAPDGTVIDGGTASVWALLGDRLVTPPSPPAIAGVARRFLLRHADKLGTRVEVAPLTAEDVDRAEEVLLTNAFGGAVAARGRGGPVSERAVALFRELWRGDPGVPLGTLPPTE